MRRGEGLGQVDLAFHADFEILRLELDVLQTPHALVDGHLAREITQSDLGQPKAFGQQGIAGDGELGFAVSDGASGACPGQ
jgi:hypothetical protein